MKNFSKTKTKQRITSTVRHFLLRREFVFKVDDKRRVPCRLFMCKQILCIFTIFLLMDSSVEPWFFFPNVIRSTSYRTPVMSIDFRTGFLIKEGVSFFPKFELLYTVPSSSI